MSSFTSKDYTIAYINIFLFSLGGGGVGVVKMNLNGWKFFSYSPKGMLHEKVKYSVQDIMFTRTIHSFPYSLSNYLYISQHLW